MSIKAQLGDIEAALKSINVEATKLANNFGRIGSGNTGFSSKAGGTATNAASFTGTSPGGGGAGGSGGSGMGGFAAAAGMGVLKGAGKAALGLGFNNIPSQADSFARLQSNFQYDVMNGWTGMSGAGMAGTLRNVVPQSQSSSGGINTMIGGLASMGVSPASMGQSAYLNKATSFMRLHEYGISNSEVPGFVNSVYGAESSNNLKLMLGGNKGTVDAQGNMRNPEDLIGDVWKHTMGRADSMTPEQILKQLQPGRAMDINLRESGQEWMRPMMEERAGAYAWLNQEENAEKKSLLVNEHDWDMSNLNQSQIQQISGIQSGKNPNEVLDDITRAKAESDANLDEAVKKGVTDANDATIKYLHLLDNLVDMRTYSAQMVQWMSNENGVSITNKALGLATEWFRGEDSKADKGVEVASDLRDLYREDPDSSVFQEGGELHYVKLDADAEDAGTAVNGVGANSGGSALGDWNVEKDKSERVHTGELIIPARIATQVRKDLARGGRPIEGTPHGVSDRTTSLGPAQKGSTKNVSNDVTINISVHQASENEVQYLASRIKQIFDQNMSLEAVSAGTF